MRRVRPPTVSETGLGYQYVRCQRGPHDDTVYIHPLCAIAGGADPHDVFSDAYDVHHLPLDLWLDLDCECPPLPISEMDLPPIDTPESVELRGRWNHRGQNLRGEADD